MPEKAAADLTARFSTLREVLHNEIRSSRHLATARMDGMDAARQQYLAQLNGRHSELEREIQGVRDLAAAQHAALAQRSETLHQEIGAVEALAAAQHASLAQQSEARDKELASGIELRVTGHTRETDDLATATQLQLDQRFTRADERTQLLQEEMDRRLAALQEELDRRFEQLNRFLDERYASEIRAFSTGRDNAMSAVNAALKSAETAVAKAEQATEKRFDSVNEFRKTLTDQAAEFPTRKEVSAQLAVIAETAANNAKALKEIELRFTSRLDTMAGKEGGAASYRSERRLDIGQIIAVIVMLAVIAGLVISLVVKK